MMEERYPRPLFERAFWQSLDGDWAFCFDDQDVGLEQKYYNEPPKDCLRIRVPFSYETPLSGIGETSHHPVVWYFRTMTAPALSEGESLLLQFEGADFETTILPSDARLICLISKLPTVSSRIR